MSRSPRSRTTKASEEENESEQTNRRRSIAGFAPESTVPTLVGIAVALVGFVLIALTWGLVAGKADVARQIPYVVSGGLTGLGLIMAGLLIVNIAAKRRDAAERTRQLEQLASVVRELNRTLHDL